MTELSIRSSLVHSKTRLPRQTTQQRSASSTRQSSVTLPIISLSSFSNCKERLSQISSHRSVTLNHNKEPGRPTPPVSSIPQQQLKFFCLDNKPNGPLTKKNRTSLLTRRSNPQFGRFLTYLRLQTLAREKRTKPQRDEKKIEPFDPMMIVNHHRQISQLFQSSSNVSLDSLATDFSSIPLPSHRLKSRSILLSPSRRIQHSTSMIKSFSPQTPTDDPVSLVTPSSPLNTPRNSLADDVDFQSNPLISSISIEYKYRFE